MRDHLLQLRIFAEEVLADVVAGHDNVLLVLAINNFAHALHEQAAVVARQDRVPVVSPDNLDHVPAGAAEGAFELLDHLAVAAHRTIQALQIAIDHEDQVVELFARGERDRAERFGLVALAVSQEAPHARVAGVFDAAVHQVLVEPRLVNAHNRPEPHRDRGELPEVRHQPRVRVARQPAARSKLLAKVRHLLLAQPTLEKRAGINAWDACPWKYTWSVARKK